MKVDPFPGSLFAVMATRKKRLIMFDIPENLTEYFVLEHETHYLGRAVERERYRVILLESVFIGKWQPTAELALEAASKSLEPKDSAA